MQRLDHNWDTFSRLVARSERHLRSGRHERAAVSAMTAATFAWCNPTGVMVSNRLEAVVAGLGASRAALLPGERPDAGLPRRVLHVATQLYATGGHTQMLANWTRLDEEREHHVCVTGQNGRPVPEKVTSALSSSGALTLLDEGSGGLMTRIDRLRSLAASFDHVVLHIHPNDVVACAAFARPRASVRTAGTAEVLLVNHADHVFWLGTTAADRVIDLRHSGARLGEMRRGVPVSRHALLLRPLRPRGREHSREEAKKLWGIDPAGVLVVTAADTYKYAAGHDDGLLDALLPALRATPGAQLHAAGPSPDGEWSVLARHGLGQAHGVLPDVHTLLEAADLYVDSYPFSSLTSMLEAASLGTPVLTLQTSGSAAAVLEADSPELDEHLVVARSQAELTAEVSRLLGEPEQRVLLGRSIEGAVRRAHGRGSWQAQVSDVLGTSGTVARTREVVDVPRQCGELDRRLLGVMQHGVGQGLTGTFAIMAPELPWWRRIATAAALAREGRASLSLLLPARGARRLNRLRASWRATTRVHA